MTKEDLVKEFDRLMEAHYSEEIDSRDEWLREIIDLKHNVVKKLIIPVVGSSLPTKERVTDQANSYAENFNKTEINLIKKQAFKAGANWLLLCYCNEVR